MITALAPAVAGDVRLFLACSKSELGAGNVGEALTGAAGSGDALVVLLATTGGAALSPEAAARPPLAPVPFGPRPLPILGNGLLFARGATPADGGVTGMFHLWKNAFTPEGLKAWGPTFRMRLPAGAYAGLVKLARDGVLDEPAAGRDMIVTCDPSVVEELAARQETFPKMWNRENQTTLADFTGEREQRGGHARVRARAHAQTSWRDAPASPATPPPLKRAHRIFCFLLSLSSTQATASSLPPRPPSTGRRGTASSPASSAPCA